MELAGLRGAACAGLDGSARLVAIARNRSPAADLRVGDMHELHLQDGCLDVVTSFRGIWGTTPEVLAEVHRVLAPGGRVGLTVWGDLRSSSGSWALSPFRLATPSQREHNSAMVALGQPGAGARGNRSRGAAHGAACSRCTPACRPGPHRDLAPQHRSDERGHRLRPRKITV